MALFSLADKVEGEEVTASIEAVTVETLSDRNDICRLHTVYEHKHRYLKSADFIFQVGEGARGVGGGRDSVQISIYFRVLSQIYEE